MRRSGMRRHLFSGDSVSPNVDTTFRVAREFAHGVPELTRMHRSRVWSLKLTS